MLQLQHPCIFAYDLWDVKMKGLHCAVCNRSVFLCVSYRVAEAMVSAKHPVLRDKDVVTMLLTS